MQAGSGECQEIVAHLLPRDQQIGVRKFSQIIGDVIQDKAGQLGLIRQILERIQEAVDDLFLKRQDVLFRKFLCPDDGISCLIDDSALGKDVLSVLKGGSSGSPALILPVCLCLLDLPFDLSGVQLCASPAQGFERFFPVLEHDVIVQGDVELGHPGIPLPAGASPRLDFHALGIHPADAEDGKAAQRCDALSEPDIGAAAGDGGRDGDSAPVSRLLDDLCLPGGVVGIQHAVGNAALQKHVGKDLTHRDRAGDDENRLALFVELYGILEGRQDLRADVGKIAVRKVDPPDLLSGGDPDNLQAIGGFQFCGILYSGPGHAGKVGEHPEQALIRHGGHGAVLHGDLQMFLCLQCLVLPGAELGVCENPPGERIDQADAAVLYNIILVPGKGGMGAQGEADVPNHIAVGSVIEVIQIKELLRLADARWRQPDVLVLRLEVDTGWTGPWGHRRSRVGWWHCRAARRPPRR